MRIVIDLQGAQAPGSRHRGIGRYSVALTKAILRNRCAHDVHLVLSGAFPHSVDELRIVFKELLPQSNIHVFNPLSPIAQKDHENAGRRRCSESLRELFIRKLNPDVIHISSLFEGMHDDSICGIGQLYTDIPTAVSLFDLIPLIHKDIYLRNLSVAKWYMERLDHLRRADACFAISESARQEAIKYLGMRSDQAINVGTAADPQFKKKNVNAAKEAELRQIYGLEKPFVMYTGGIDFRKNIETLIRAYSSLPRSLRRRHQLAIVCSVLDADKERLMALAAETGLKAGELVMTGFVPEDHLISLYNLTELFVFPSLHEGFGLPALEAMHCGAPVIASNTSSLPEVVGLEEALFDPHDESAIARSISRALRDPKHRSILKKNSEKQSKVFDWDECGRRAVAAFEHLEKSKSRHIPSVTSTRPRLACVSPLPPAKTGIATYTSDLIPELSRYYRVDLVVKDHEISQVDVGSNLGGANIVSESQFRANARSYDRIIYQFGNSDNHDHMFALLKETGGVVVLHDFFLSGILAHLEWSRIDTNAWTQELYRSHGYKGLIFRKDAAEEVDALWQFPCSQSVAEAADHVIVHSKYSQNLARKWYGDELAKRFTIIPHLREATFEVDRSAARQKLGIDEGDFVVCSFGFVSPTKLSHQLIDAWSNSKLNRQGRCRLIFVGENHPGEYGQQLQRLIDKFTGKGTVSITGWADNEDFQTYLAAADVAVQLRTLSRGETSGAVLDCMNFGVPVIVNANGSMADLPLEAAIILPENFTSAELAGELEELYANGGLRDRMSSQARRIISEEHSPKTCAESYMRTIELAALESSLTERLVSDSLQAGLTADEVREISREVANLATNSRSRLLVDVTELAAADAGSGIQRVVKNIVMQLLVGSASELRIEPVYTDPHTREFRFARKFTSQFLGVDIGGLPDDIVDVTSRDTLLFLDLNPVGIPIMRETIAKYKRQGTKCVYVVYDLLAVKHPEHFLPDADSYYRDWLECVAEGSGALCISKAVASDLRAYLDKRGLGETLQIRHFPLGSDVGANASDAQPGSSIFSKDLGLDHLKPTFLMVGTIEPRKRHVDVIEAFEGLWKDGEDINLCVIGKQGWLVDDLVAQMVSLGCREKRFIWRSSVSDEQLLSLYESSVCLIAASIDEGYGLPLVEGAARELYLIARDIPVFREVCGDAAVYFSSDLAEVLRNWLTAYRTNALQPAGRLKTFTWKESTEALLRELSLVTA